MKCAITRSWPHCLWREMAPIALPLATVRATVGAESRSVPEWVQISVSGTADTPHLLQKGCKRKEQERLSIYIVYIIMYISVVFFSPKLVLLFLNGVQSSSAITRLSVCTAAAWQMRSQNFVKIVAAETTANNIFSQQHDSLLRICAACEPLSSKCWCFVLLRNRIALIRSVGCTPLGSSWLTNKVN